MEITVIEILKNLGVSIAKATILTILTQVVGSEMRICGKELNERIVQSIRFAKNSFTNS